MFKNKLSLVIPQNEPQPEVPTEEFLRNSFNLLNNRMFETVNKPDLKDMMTQIMESCLHSLRIERSFACDKTEIKELKIRNTSVNNIFFIGDKLHEAEISSVHVYACDNVVYKRSSFLITETNSFFKLILEICLQNYALSLRCRLKIPAIYDYVLLRRGDYLAIEVKMEMVNMLDVEDPDIKEQIVNSYKYLIPDIKSHLDCLNHHGLYHNDTHSDNLGFYKEPGIRGIHVVLIDFGKASLTPVNRYPSISGFYEEIKGQAEIEQWLEHAISQNAWARSLYGGRKRRTRRNKKHRKRKTHRRK